jgi:hypothetical protein
MAGLTLDAGALIAIERGDARVAAFIEATISRLQQVTVPAPVVAQAWRSPRNVRLQRLLQRVAIEPFMPTLAFDVGALLSRTRTADVIDAMLVLTASHRHDIVLTDDPDDIAVLARSVIPRIQVLTVQSLHR